MKMLLLLLLVALPISIRAHSRFGEKICHVRGKCNGGEMSVFTKTQGHIECIDVCNDAPGCNWTSFANGVCRGFKTCPSLDASCEDCVSSKKYENLK